MFTDADCVVGTFGVSVTAAGFLLQTGDVLIAGDGAPVLLRSDGMEVVLWLRARWDW